MPLPSEAVRAFLASIGVQDDAIERGLRSTDDPRVAQDILYRVIAHAKAKGVTADGGYNDVVRRLRALTNGGGRLVTKADKLFAAAPRDYAASKKECEAAIARWEWWTGDRYPLAPFYNERHRFSPGKKVAAPTTEAKKRGLYGFGIDPEGRVRVVRQYNEIGHYEIFRVHAPDRVEQRHYSYSRHEPIHAQVLELAEGRPMTCHFRAGAGASVERYTWEGEQLSRIAIQRASAPFQELELRYDALSELAAIADVSALDAKFHSVIWERPQKGASLGKLLPRIRDLFVELLVAELRARRFDGPIYALALVVDSEAYDHLLPPSVALATVKEREAFVATQGARASDFLWSPPEWNEANAFQLWDDRMKALATPANHLLWTTERYADALKLANGLAKTLNATELPIERDPDFVVFACELDGQSGATGIAKAAPAQLRRRLAPLLGARR